MPTSAEINNEANRVLAAIKSGTGNVGDLQRDYAKLSRRYSAAVAAEWAQAPMVPA